LAAAILTRPPKPLDEFDQPFYLTVAYDLIHHGVFSNGFINLGNAADVTPSPGMFFGPLYPSLIAGVTEIDARFAKTVDCGAETYRAKRSATECDVYVRPMLLIHALLLTLGVLAVARAAELLFAERGIFWLTGVVATGALLADANQFSFLMTESMIFSLYALAMLAMVLGWTTSKSRYFVMAGLGLCVLCLARFSFLAAALVMPALIAINSRFVVRPHRGWAMVGVLGFVLAFLAVIVPWATRNAISLGKFALTEEYGSVTLVERVAYDQMTLREFVLAFPYCLPQIGPAIVRHAFGADAMARFHYDLPNSFYAIGVAHRDALTEQFTRIDPIIGELVRHEMKDNWWRYILVSIPLAWCGMWVGGWLGLAIVPLFCNGVRSSLSPVKAIAPALCHTRLGDARAPCRARQLLHALQSCPDRSVFRSRGLAHRVDYHARASAIASSLVCKVISTSRLPRRSASMCPTLLAFADEVIE
jgi:hypothetical protein